MIDIEEITIAYLLTVDALDDLAVDIVPDTPDSLGSPWVRVIQLDALDAAAQVEYLHSFLVQFDCYAGADGGQVEASAIARAVRAALADMRNHDHTGAVITNVRFTGHLRDPDPDIEPARERYIVTAEITGHTA